MVRHELDMVERELVREYRGLLPAAVVHQYVDEALDAMWQVRVPRLIPVLVVHAVRERAPRPAPRRRRRVD